VTELKNPNAEFLDDDTDLNEGTWFDSEEEDIEPEEEGITEPFDPTKIRVDTRQMTVDLLLSRIQHDELDIAPGFQRREGIWTNDAKSRLIESILIRIPLPAFYIDATDDDKWLVIDGIQRLTALKQFIIDKQLTLSGLQSLIQLEGKTYDELPRHYQRRILETPLIVILLEKGTSPEVKFTIFKRINTSALPLSSQEIRHALNQGPATNLLAKLADSDEFKKATSNSISNKRMVDRECILRVLAFMIHPDPEQKQQKFDEFLNERMSDINRMSTQQIELLEKEFSQLMVAAFEIFEEDGFRKPSQPNEAKYPVNKALFEAWSVNLYKLSEEELKILKDRKDDLKQKIIDLTNEGKFDNPVYRSTGSIKTALRRFSDIEQLIKAVL
jgi:uncharacterized protein with ParB-like and HNH nuclease domain